MSIVSMLDPVMMITSVLLPSSVKMVTTTRSTTIKMTSTTKAGKIIMNDFFFIPTNFGKILGIKREKNLIF